MRGVQRLQDVVARRGEEAGLGDVGALGVLLGGYEIEVGLFQPPQRGAQLVGADPDATLEIDRGLEQREGIALLVHRPFDAREQRVVDALQAVDVVDLRQRHYSAACRWPKAMPVKVWFRCMDRYCSPYVPKPTTLFSR